MENDSAEPPIMEIAEAPIEEQEAPLEGNEPEETTEAQEPEPESTDNEGSEVEGGSEEDTDSTSTEPEAKKGEEKPSGPPETVQVGAVKYEVKKLVDAYKKAGEAQKLFGTAQQALRFMGDSPRQAVLSVLTAKLGSKEKAQEEWTRLCEETVIENHKRATESPEERRARELDEREATLKEQEKNALQRRQTAETEKARQVILPKIQDALKASGQDPEDPGLIGMVAEIMAKAADDGGYMSPEDAVPVALDRLDSYWSVRLKSYPKDKLLGLRPELKKDIIDESIQAVRAAKAPAKTAQKAEPAKPRKNEGQKVISQGQFRRMFS